MNQPSTGPGFPTGDFVKGHLTAFEKVYDACHPIVLRFALGLLQDAPVADSIVNDSFLKLWIQHADIDSLQNIEAFLHIGIQRSCFSYLKQVEQLAPAQRQKLQEATAALASSASGTASAGEAAALTAVILGWFSHLPPTTADIARLAYKEGLDDIQVCARLGIPVDFVKDQKLKGMLLIKEQWFSKTEKELAAFRALLQKARQ